MKIYKVTFQDTETEKEFSFYCANLSDDEYGILNGGFFNTEITDAKTLKKFIIKDEIINALKDDNIGLINKK